MFRNNLLLRFLRKMYFPQYTDQQNLVEHNVGSHANVNLSSSFTGLDTVCVVWWKETAECCSVVKKGTVVIARPLATGMLHRVRLLVAAVTKIWRHRPAMTTLRAMGEAEQSNWMPEGNLFSPKCPDRSTQSLIKWTAQVPSPRIKRPASEADHSLPSSADVHISCMETGFQTPTFFLTD